MCDAMYSGSSIDELCLVCADRNRRRIYADPTDPLRWMRRQLMRVDIERELGAIADGLPVGGPSTGFCSICGKALDDHGLMYSNQPYAVGLCKLKKEAPPEDYYE